MISENLEQLILVYNQFALLKAELELVSEKRFTKS